MKGKLQIFFWLLPYDLFSKKKQSGKANKPFAILGLPLEFVWTRTIFVASTFFILKIPSRTLFHKTPRFHGLGQIGFSLGNTRNSICCFTLTQIFLAFEKFHFLNSFFNWRPKNSNCSRESSFTMFFNKKCENVLRVIKKTTGGTLAAFHLYFMLRIQAEIVLSPNNESKPYFFNLNFRRRCFGQWKISPLFEKKRITKNWTKMHEIWGLNVRLCFKLMENSFWNSWYIFGDNF